MIGRSKSGGRAVRVAGLMLLVAGLLLTAAVGTALAAAPKNTASPTISPNPPVIGGTATATTGTWNSEAPAHWFEGESVRLKEGEKVTVKETTGQIAYTAIIGGLEGSISCELAVSGASVENPNGGGAGVGNAALQYRNCKTSGQWQHCTGSFGVGSTPVGLTLGQTEGKAKVAIAPSGETLGTFTLSGAECPEALEGNLKVFGTINGFYSNSNSAIEVTAESSGGKKLHLKNPTTGPVATAAGTIGLHTTKGTSFSASALTYTYAWSRCEKVESGCVAISGATSLSYAPVRADLGKYLQVAVTATDPNGSTSAFGHSSAVVGVPSWYESPSENVWQKASTGTSVTSTNTMVPGEREMFQIWIIWTTGFEMPVECKAASGEGKLNNGSSQASIEGYSLQLGECTLVKETCSTSNSLAFSPLKVTSEAAATTFNKGLTVGPTSGTVLLTFKVSGCKAEGLNGEYQLRGELPAQFNSEGNYVVTSALEGLSGKGVSVYLQGAKIGYAGINSKAKFFSGGTKPVKLDVAP